MSEPWPPALPPPRPNRGALLAHIVILWLVIAGAVAVTAIDNSHAPTSFTAGQTTPDPAQERSIELELSARYIVGIWSLNQANPAILIPVIAQVEKQPHTSLEKLRLAMIVGLVQGAPAGLDQVNDLMRGLPRDSDLRADAQVFRQSCVAGPTSLSPAQRQRLLARHGWFAQVALAYGAAPNSAAEQAAVLPAKRAFAAMAAAFVAGFTAFLAGLVLCITAIVWLALGKVRLAFRRPIGTAVPFLESFAIYLTGIVALNNLPSQAEQLPVWVRLGVVVLIAVLGISWPLLRGVTWRDYRRAVGWHAGTGALREIGAGLAAYVGGLPILAVGVLITLFLDKLTGIHPTHPIVRMVGQSPGRTVELFFLASIYAPITEETLFRGALFHYLRGWHGWLLSASIVSAIFAALHPQGWTVMPALFSMALVFAMMREWRGSILPSMAAHALNNTLVLTLLIVCVS